VQGDPGHRWVLLRLHGTHAGLVKGLEQGVTIIPV
jgi:hypothetical protein